MRKQKLVNNIMSRVKHSINESVSLHEDALLTENNDKAQYIFEISSRKSEMPKSVAKLFQFANDKLSIDEGVKSFKIYCKDESELSSVNSIIVKQHVLDKFDDIVIKLYKKSKSTINDSVNEAAGVVEGDFQTTFTFSQYNEADKELTPDRAAKLHVKYLLNNGLTVDIKPRRYDYLYTIHYVGQEQFDTLVHWIAWDFGYTEAINNKPSKKIISEISEIIRSGKA